MALRMQRLIILLITSGLLAEPKHLEYIEMLITSKENIQRVSQDNPVQKVKIFVESDSKMSPLPLKVDSWYPSEQSTVDSKQVIDKRQVSNFTSGTNAKDLPVPRKSPTNLEEVGRSTYKGLGESIVLTVDDISKRVQPKPLQYEPSSRPIQVDQQHNSQKQAPFEEVYQQKRPTYFETTRVEEVYQNERPLYSEREPNLEENSKRKPTRQVYEEQEEKRPDDHSIYPGFPESYQPQRNPSPSQSHSFSARVFPASPCLGVFQYIGQEPGEDEWTGEIYVNTDEVLIGMRLDIQLDRPAHLLTNWISDVTTNNNEHYTILSLTKRLIPGAAETVRIRIRFDPNKPVPYLKTINLNGRRICPARIQGVFLSETTKKPVYENPGDLQTTAYPPKRVTEHQTVRYVENTERTRGTTVVPYEDMPITQKATRYTEKRPEPTSPPKRATTTPVYIVRPDPNPNYYEESEKNKVMTTKRPYAITTEKPKIPDIACGKPAVQPRPLITKGQMTARGQWPWHAAIYRNVGVDLGFICGGSLISSKLVVTAAHCVAKSYNKQPLDPSGLVVYLGKYHLKLWSEGGIQNKQVSNIHVHDLYNNSDYRADIAVLVLSSPVQFTDLIRPVCLWDKASTDIKDIEGKVGTVVGWGYDETLHLTEELMQAHMPVIQQNQCLYSYPAFFAQFTSNLTYCAGFKNGTSVCNGDSGGGMVFPIKTRDGEERWYLRGIVSISVSEKNNKVCDVKHYVVFADVAKFLDWLEKFLKNPT